MIIITGGSGFIGTETIKLLEKKGHEYFNFDLLLGYNICNINQLLEVIKEGDTVLHLAAVSRFNAAEMDASRCFKINIGGTLNVVQACIKNKAKRLIYSSTGSVYLPVQSNPIDETHRLCIQDRNISKSGTFNVYSWSKAMTDLLVQQHYSQISSIILRYAHLYGKEKLHGGIGVFTNRLMRGLKPTIFGGNQSNDFLYVKDVARANLISIEADKSACGNEYNIGTGEEISIMRAFETVSEALGSDIEPNMKTGRNVDSARFVYNVQKAELNLGFVAKCGFKDGIKDLIKELKDK